MKISYKVALGGICMALSVLLISGTAIIPILSFALPAFAGIVLIPLNLELGKKWTVLVYIGVSLLGFFVSPDHTATISFVVLFGCYPILKEVIESIRKRWLEWVLKVVVFNLSVLVGAAISVTLFGLDYFIAEYAEFGSWGIWALVGFALFCEAAFVLYDYALTKMITYIIIKIMPLFKIIR